MPMKGSMHFWRRENLSGIINKTYITGGEVKFFNDE
jgi:hypothetical protein